MSETWASANARRACLDCGESDADLYRTTRGEHPGRLVRVCQRCAVAHDWYRFGLVAREPLPEETP